MEYINKWKSKWYKQQNGISTFTWDKQKLHIHVLPTAWVSPAKVGVRSNKAVNTVSCASLTYKRILCGSLYCDDSLRGLLTGLNSSVSKLLTSSYLKYIEFIKHGTNTEFPLKDNARWSAQNCLTNKVNSTYVMIAFPVSMSNPSTLVWLSSYSGMGLKRTACLLRFSIE